MEERTGKTDRRTFIGQAGMGLAAAGLLPGKQLLAVGSRGAGRQTIGFVWG